MEIDRFWFVSKNKTALQQLFTNWVLNKVKSEQFDKPFFLGGSHKENHAMCFSFVNGLVSVERLLKCRHEEADDRIFFHANHAIKIRIMEALLLHLLTQIYLYPHYIVSAN